MSPILGTRGNISARNFGWGSSTSLGGNGYFAVLADSGGTSANTGIGGMSVNGAGTAFISVIMNITNTKFRWYSLNSSGSFLARSLNNTVTLTASSVSGGRSLSSSSANGISCVNDSANANQFYVIKTDTSLTGSWSRSFTWSSLTTDAGNPGYTAMDVNGNIHFWTASGGTSTVQALVKYDSAGTIQWQRRVSGLPAQGGDDGAIAVDGSGNIVTTTFRTSSTRQIFYWNSSGVLQWQKYIGTVGSTGQTRGAIGFDTSGNVLFSGSSGTTTYVVKLNSSGVIQWQRSLTTVVSGSSTRVVSDNADNVYVVITPSSGGAVSYVIKYDSSGALQWQRSFTFSGTSSTFWLRTATFNPLGYITFAGGLSNNSGANAFPPAVIQYPTTGTPSGAYTASGYTVTIATSSLTDAASSLTVTNTTYTEAAGIGTDASATVHTTTTNTTTTNTTTVIA